MHNNNLNFKDTLGDPFEWERAVDYIKRRSKRVVLAYNWRSMVCSMGKEHGQNRGPTYPHTGVLACPQATKRSKT
jgi:hypothetical protein